ncbi:hypothetical protein Tco_1153804 [Tanacetum coccineum]
MGNDSLRSCIPLLELNRFEILLGELEEGQVVSSVIDGILSIEARDMDTKLLSAPESNNTLVASSGWPFVSVVPGQITYLVSSLTLDSTGSCVMQGTFLIQGKASSIPTIFSWDGSISPDSFLPSIMLLLVIIVAVAIVVKVVLVVVVGEGSSIIKLSFVIIGSLHRIVLCYLIHKPLTYGNVFFQSLRL